MGDQIGDISLADRGDESGVEDEGVDTKERLEGRVTV